MSKCYELREYDTITYNDSYSKNEKYCVVLKTDYDELKKYIESFDCCEDDDDIRFFFQISNRGITARNYVGIIQLESGTQFQILPKVDLADDDINFQSTKHVLLDMLKSMLNFNGRTFEQANINTYKMNLYEIFINMYLCEVFKLIKTGMKSAYISIEDNITYYKGKLSVSNHLKHNFINKAKFYMQYDELMLNRPENRLIKSGLLKIAKLSSNNDNLRHIRQALTSFSEVDASSNYEKDFAMVVIDRNTKEYTSLIRWTRVILYDLSFTSFSGGTRAISILFPMERLFESYVAKKMKAVFGQDGWEVSSQDRLYHLFDKPKMFEMRPDIVLTNKETNRIIVLDTKWKRLVPNSLKNYGIKQADMYQMYAYSKKYHTNEIWLLYPLNSEMQGCKDIKFESYEFAEEDSSVDVCVRIFFVDVGRINYSLLELKNLI